MERTPGVHRGARILAQGTSGQGLPDAMCPGLGTPGAGSREGVRGALPGAIAP